MKNLITPILTLLTLASGITALVAAEATKPARPNILFIYADELGFGDIACHGHPRIKTLNLASSWRGATSIQTSN